LSSCRRGVRFDSAIVTACRYSRPVLQPPSAAAKRPHQLLILTGRLAGPACSVSAARTFAGRSTSARPASCSYRRARALPPSPSVPLSRPARRVKAASLSPRRSKLPWALQLPLLRHGNRSLKAAWPVASIMRSHPSRSGDDRPSVYVPRVIPVVASRPVSFRGSRPVAPALPLPALFRVMTAS